LAMIACVCIVAKENNPLLLRVFEGAGEDETKFHHICYCSIDAFEEKEQAMRCARPRARPRCCAAALRACRAPAPGADGPRRRLARRRATTGGPRQIDSFLGVLVLVQDYRVYGYVTNTGVRFVLVVDDKDNKDSRWGAACCRAPPPPSVLLLAHRRHPLAPPASCARAHADAVKPAAPARTRAA